MNINTKQFIVDLPQYHPLSADYRLFWLEQWRRCIEGYWVGGYYMPPSLYFYVNMGHIEGNFDKRNPNLKGLMRPWLRDLEWEFFRSWTVARGFSGFEGDDEYSSYLPLKDFDPDLVHPPSIYREDGTLKQFVPPQEMLSMQHSYHKGRPLYENHAYNLMMMGSRDTGKSYMVGIGILLHQFIMDGATVFSEESLKNPQRVEMTVGAESSQKSDLMLNKTKIALDLLPGSLHIGGRYYPAPFYKRHRGSWTVGKNIEAFYTKKVKGGWINAGSRSMIKHRTFKDNPFADQGSRPLAIILEEVGLFSNLKQVYANTKDNLRSGLRKTGSLVMLGTGGDMESGTVDAHEMFYSPETYQILPFPDIWENRSSPIGMFVPAYMAINDFKDDNGFSLIEKAKKALHKERDKARTSKGGSFALNKEMQYRPLVPSEMFLTRSSNLFPVPELRKRLSVVHDDDSSSTPVNLIFDPSAKQFNGVSYEVDTTLLPINNHPWPDDAPREGAVQIYEFPKIIDDRVPPDAYIIGCDPYKDDNHEGESMAAIFVMKTSRYPSTVGYDQIVASYVGRPYYGKNHVNEILYKLSLFYGNAKIYFENAVGNIKDYFEKIHKLELLALQPTTVFNKKASYNTNLPMVYGYPMSNQKVKWEALQYVRQWLLQERENSSGYIIRNLDLIQDKYLLQQLVQFTMDGNFDAVMGLVGCIIGLEENHNWSKRRAAKEIELSNLDKDIKRLITNNKQRFNEKFSQTTSLF